jgi:hypothetical protein
MISAGPPPFDIPTPIMLELLFVELAGGTANVPPEKRKRALARISASARELINKAGRLTTYDNIYSIRDRRPLNQIDAHRARCRLTYLQTGQLALSICDRMQVNGVKPVDL